MEIAHLRNFIKNSFICWYHHCYPSSYSFRVTWKI